MDNLSEPLTKKQAIKQTFFLFLIIVLIIIILFSIFSFKFKESLSIKLFLIPFVFLLIMIGIGAFVGYKIRKKTEQKYKKQTRKNISKNLSYSFIIIGILMFIINGIFGFIKKQPIYFLYSGLGLIIFVWELFRHKKLNKYAKKNANILENNNTRPGRFS